MGLFIYFLLLFCPKWVTIINVNKSNQHIALDIRIDVANIIKKLVSLKLLIISC